MDHSKSAKGGKLKGEQGLEQSKQAIIEKKKKKGN